MTGTQKLLKEINEAFAESNADFIIQNVTDDIKWTAAGDFTVQGIDEFSRKLREMATGHDYTLEIKNLFKWIQLKKK